jgi:hypothetical protein
MHTSSFFRKIANKRDQWFGTRCRSQCIDIRGMVRSIRVQASKLKLETQGLGERAWPISVHRSTLKSKDSTDKIVKQESLLQISTRGMMNELCSSLDPRSRWRQRSRTSHPTTAKVT